MADDDEDEGFGDFKFVSYSTKNSNQITINNKNYGNNNDDDDWGDFVDNFSSPRQDLNHKAQPIQFQQYSPNPNNNQNFDFFGGLSDQKPIQAPPNSKPDLERKNSIPNSPVWEKPKGALPLSLFGDDEEEEQEVQQFDQMKGFSDYSRRNTQSPVKRIEEPNYGSGFAIKDIIVNLYTQSDQIKKEEENLKVDEIGNQNGGFEDDDDGWEFKDASVDNKPEISFSELKAEVKSSENTNGVHGGGNWFVASNELGNKPTEMENGLVYKSGGGVIAERSFAFDPLSQSKKIGVENGVNSELVEDENFADFQDSFSPTGAANHSTTQKVESKIGHYSSVQGKELMFDNAFHVNGYESWDNPKTMPASNFSNGKLDSEISLFGEDLFLNKPPTSISNQEAVPASNLSNGKLSSEASLFGEEDLFTDKPLTSRSSQGASAFSNFSTAKLDRAGSLFGEDLFLNKPSTSLTNQEAPPASNFSNGKLGSGASLFSEEDLFTDKPSTSKSSQGASPVSNFSSAKLDTAGSLFGEDLFLNKPSTSTTNLEALPASSFSNIKLGSDAFLFGKEDLFTDKPSTSKSSEVASPISNFSSAKPDSAGSLFGDDIFSYKSSNTPSNGLHNKVGSSNTFNDLISNLYSQTEHTSTVPEATENQCDSSQANLSSDLANDEDDFDENAWEFRAAPLESSVPEATGNPCDSSQANFSSNLANDEDDFDENAWEFRAAPLESSVQKATEKQFDSSQTKLSSDLANEEDDFDEAAWEFRAAPLQTSVETHPANEFQRSPYEATENGFNSVQSNLANGGSYFDGNSWDFEGSLSEVNAEIGPGDSLQKSPTASKHNVLSSQEASHNRFDVDMFDFEGALSKGCSKTESGDILSKCPTDAKLKTCIDFYCRLKEESYHLALHHLDALKKAKTAAALSSDDIKADAIHHEIQEAYKILHRDGWNSETANMDGRQTRKAYVEEFLELMKEPVIQMLDSEFNMSSRMSLAEKSLSSAIEIFEHSIFMSKILTLGSMEDQFTYVSKWSLILSACSEELKHGAFIWKQSLENKVDQQILSKPKGQQYILALGEIYRVVEILRISTKLYWPWIVSTLVNPVEIVALLEECSAAWLDSKLEDALLSVSDQVGVGYAAKILVESLKSAHDLDMSALQKHVLQEPICNLSLLSLKAVSGMKEVVWNGEQYLLTLANLWGNLVSSYPPKLPHIYAIS